MGRGRGTSSGSSTQYYPMHRTVPTTKSYDPAPDVNSADGEKTWMPVSEGQKERRGMRL